MKIYLIGMMGSGKSTVGKLLSERLKIKFVDLDSIIEDKTHKTVAEIFEQNGENHFRELESNILEKSKGVEGVVACGGGIILDEKNRHILKSSGEIIFLKSSVSELVKRLHSADDRPLLADKQIEKELDIIWSARKILYEQTAHLIISVDGRTPKEITELILDQLN